MSDSAEPAQHSELTVVNVPNLLTAARLILAVIMFAAQSVDQYTVALCFFVLAAGTDWMDGYWARKYNQVTKVGRIFDPFVDKVLICGVFIFLAAEYPRSGVHPGLAVVVFAREMLVTALRSSIEQSGGDFSANWPGKWKMVFQCAAVILSLITLAEYPTPTWFPWLLIASVWLAVLSTIYSGGIYVVAAVKFFRREAQQANHPQSEDE